MFHYANGRLHRRESRRRGEHLKLGDISIHRNLGWPPECAKAMWMMLEHDRTEDFVIASGGDQ
jgi:GDP-D-mannose dehydratase